ncbi:MAG: DUF3567 family protein, partial [Betaproteobacteria bacterium]
MNVVYNSENYYVVEYAEHMGFELVDKLGRRSAFFYGDSAQRFAESINGAIAQDASRELIDEFLGNFGDLMGQP